MAVVMKGGILLLVVLGTVQGGLIPEPGGGHHASRGSPHQPDQSGPQQHAHTSTSLYNANPQQGMMRLAFEHKKKATSMPLDARYTYSYQQVAVRPMQSSSTVLFNAANPSSGTNSRRWPSINDQQQLQHQQRQGNSMQQRLSFQHKMGVNSRYSYSSDSRYTYSYPYHQRRSSTSTGLDYATDAIMDEFSETVEGIAKEWKRRNSDTSRSSSSKPTGSIDRRYEETAIPRVINPIRSTPSQQQQGTSHGSDGSNQEDSTVLDQMEAQAREWSRLNGEDPDQMSMSSFTFHSQNPAKPLQEISATSSGTTSSPAFESTPPSEQQQQQQQLAKEWKDLNRAPADPNNGPPQPMPRGSSSDASSRAPTHPRPRSRARMMTSATDLALEWAARNKEQQTDRWSGQPGLDMFRHQQQPQQGQKQQQQQQHENADTKQGPPPPVPASPLQNLNPKDPHVTKNDFLSMSAPHESSSVAAAGDHPGRNVKEPPENAVTPAKGIEDPPSTPMTTRLGEKTEDRVENLLTQLDQLNQRISSLKSNDNEKDESATPTAAAPAQQAPSSRSKPLSTTTSSGASASTTTSVASYISSTMKKPESSMGTQRGINEPSLWSRVVNNPASGHFQPSEKADAKKTETSPPVTPLTESATHNGAVVSHPYETTEVPDWVVDRIKAESSTADGSLPSTNDNNAKADNDSQVTSDESLTASGILGEKKLSANELVKSLSTFVPDATLPVSSTNLLGSVVSSASGIADASERSATPRKESMKSEAISEDVITEGWTSAAPLADNPEETLTGVVKSSVDALKATKSKNINEVKRPTPPRGSRLDAPAPRRSTGTAQTRATGTSTHNLITAPKVAPKKRRRSVAAALSHSQPLFVEPQKTPLPRATTSRWDNGMASVRPRRAKTAARSAKLRQPTIWPRKANTAARSTKLQKPSTASVDTTVKNAFSPSSVVDPVRRVSMTALEEVTAAATRKNNKAWSIVAQQHAEIETLVQKLQKFEATSEKTVEAAPTSPSDTGPTIVSKVPPTLKAKKPHIRAVKASKRPQTIAPSAKSRPWTRAKTSNSGRLAKPKLKSPATGTKNSSSTTRADDVRVMHDESTKADASLSMVERKKDMSKPQGTSSTEAMPFATIAGLQRQWEHKVNKGEDKPAPIVVEPRDVTSACAIAFAATAKSDRQWATNKLEVKQASAYVISEPCDITAKASNSFASVAKHARQWALGKRKVEKNEAPIGVNQSLPTSTSSLSFPVETDEISDSLPVEEKSVLPHAELETISDDTAETAGTASTSEPTFEVSASLPFPTSKIPVLFRVTPAAEKAPSTKKLASVATIAQKFAKSMLEPPRRSLAQPKYTGLNFHRRILDEKDEMKRAMIAGGIASIVAASIAVDSVLDWHSPVKSEVAINADGAALTTGQFESSTVKKEMSITSPTVAASSNDDIFVPRLLDGRYMMEGATSAQDADIQAKAEALSLSSSPRTEVNVQQTLKTVLPRADKVEEKAFVPRLLHDDSLWD